MEGNFGIPDSLNSSKSSSQSPPTEGSEAGEVNQEAADPFASSGSDLFASSEGSSNNPFGQ